MWLMSVSYTRVAWLAGKVYSLVCRERVYQSYDSSQGDGTPSQGRQHHFSKDSAAASAMLSSVPSVISLCPSHQQGTGEQIRKHIQ